MSRTVCRDRVVKGALAVLAIAVSARAATASPMSWRAPRGCPAVEEAELRVAQRLGGVVDARVLAGLAVSIEAEGAGFTARVASGPAAEPRALRAARCDELVDAIAVVIARIVTDRREAEAPGARAARAPEAAVDLAVDAAGAAAAPSPSGTAARGRWGGGVRLLGLTGIGSLPGVALGGELAVFVRRGEAFGELAAARWRPNGVALLPLAPGRVDIGLDLAALRIGWQSTALPLRAWVTGELGALSGDGVGLGGPEFGSTTWTSVGAGFGVAWPIARHVRLVGELEVVAALARGRFMLASGSELYRPEALSARANLGFELGWL